MVCPTPVIPKVVLTAMLLVVVPAVSPAATPGLSDMSRAVLSIQTTVPFSLAGEPVGIHYGTGVVLDQRHGIVLVDRSAIGHSPRTAVGYLFNRRRVDLVPVWFDPTHNFGFYRVDPDLLAENSVGRLKIGDSDIVTSGQGGITVQATPDHRIEMSQVVIGDLFHDPVAQTGGDEMNVYYWEIAGGNQTSGNGILVDSRHRLIGLVIREGRSDLVLPINTVRYAFAKIQNNEAVPRGSIGLVLQSLFIDALQDRGVAVEQLSDKDVRPSDRRLVVARTLSGFAAAEIFQPGDVLLRIDGRPVADRFGVVEGVIDEKFGGHVAIEFLRSDQKHSVELPVTDLKTFQVGRFLACDGGVFHELHLGAIFEGAAPGSGLYISWVRFGSPLDSYSIRAGHILTKVNDIPVTSIADLIRVLGDQHQPRDLKFSTVDMRQSGERVVGTLRSDPIYFPCRYFERDDAGQWSEWSTVEAMQLDQLRVE